ncbi:tyrosine-type recombinase/integrase [Lacrimispora sp.]|nr:tyrosine-type recombinase/integrase [Lacrimispora sp.]
MITLPDDITAHTFRHTYASALNKAGVDIERAQYLLGHDDI